MIASKKNRQENKNRGRHPVRKISIRHPNFDDILQNLEGGFICVDDRWRCNYVNDKALGLIDKTRTELLGKSFLKVFQDILSKANKQECRKTMNKKLPSLFVTKFDKEKKWVEVHCYPNKKGISVFVNDITTKKKSDQRKLSIVKRKTSELATALEHEKELSDIKSMFVSLASHEFRGPLSTILSSIDLIENYSVLKQPENIHKHVERIRTSVRHLSNLLDDFLSLEKLEQGKIKIENAYFDFSAFNSEITEELENTLKKEQKIQYAFKGGKEIYSDRKIIYHILLNLLSNAIKYSDGDIVLEVAVDERYVSIVVRDNGIGIPEEEQRRLFSRYFRANNVGNIKGTGLGLSIVKGYVELLNGSISFVSAKDVGTTFVVKFPLEIPNAIQVSASGN